MEVSIMQIRRRAIAGTGTSFTATLLFSLLIAALASSVHAQTQTVPPVVGPWWFGFALTFGGTQNSYSTCHKGSDESAVVQQTIADFNANRVAWFAPYSNLDVVFDDCSGPERLGTSIGGPGTS